MSTQYLIKVKAAGLFVADQTYAGANFKVGVASEARRFEFMSTANLFAIECGLRMSEFEVIPVKGEPAAEGDVQ